MGTTSIPLLTRTHSNSRTKIVCNLGTIHIFVLIRKIMCAVQNNHQCSGYNIYFFYNI